LRQRCTRNRLELELRRHQSMAGRLQIRIAGERLTHQVIQGVGVKQLIPILRHFAAKRDARGRFGRGRGFGIGRAVRRLRPHEVGADGAGSGCDCQQCWNCNTSHSREATFHAIFSDVHIHPLAGCFDCKGAR
jgi:hypothetical protein